MRGVGAICTAPTTHGRPKRMAVNNHAEVAVLEQQVELFASVQGPRLIVFHGAVVREDNDGRAYACIVE